MFNKNFMHFFRRPTINLDVFTQSAIYMQATPINYGMKFIPDWWKNLPNQQPTPYETKVTNMRGCIGMYDLYAKSIIMPLWTEVVVDIVSGGNHVALQAADSTTRFIRHEKSQAKGFLDSASQHHVKTASPWFFRTKEDVTWVMSNPMYNMRNISDYYIFPGVLNFNKQSFTNLQMGFSSEVTKKLLLPAGLPIAMFTPMTDKKIKLHRHLVDIGVMNTLASQGAQTAFTNTYIKNQKNIKHNGCPFTDHTGVIK